MNSTIKANWLLRISSRPENRRVATYLSVKLPDGTQCNCAQGELMQLAVEAGATRVINSYHGNAAVIGLGSQAVNILTYEPSIQEERDEDGYGPLPDKGTEHGLNSQCRQWAGIGADSKTLDHLREVAHMNDLGAKTKDIIEYIQVNF